MSIEMVFTRQTLETYLKELAKEFKKRGGGTRAEMILVGGASVIINYGFRAASYDVDATYDFPSVMKEAINAIADRYGLPNGWVNDDFKKTSSYTDKIVLYSEYYRTFSGVLEIRTVRAEYLVAMKLVSGRQYKKDLSDVAGIIFEQKMAGKPLNMEMIDKAMANLYGDWSLVSEYARTILDRILACDDLEKLFVELSDDEVTAREALSEVVRKYPGIANRDNVDDVIAAALKRKNQRDKN